MHLRESQLVFSATDLANYLGCRHLTQLECRVAKGERSRPFRTDERLDTLRQLGQEHETRYVEHLREQGKSVVDLTADGKRSTVSDARDAMRSGADVIVQAELGRAEFWGRADLLLRVERPSELGDWSYEVADTKLSAQTRGGTLLQLCLYSDLLRDLQGVEPTTAYVVKPGDPFETEQHPLSQYWAFFRWVRQRMVQSVVEEEPTYPQPVAHCDICSWYGECRQRLRDDDHLSLVAGVSKLQIVELNQRSLTTLEAFAEDTGLASVAPSRGSLASLLTAQQQAQIQLRGRRSGNPEHELLPIRPGEGFSRLPAPDPGDLFFDLEGERLSPGGGAEYLFGYALADGEQGATMVSEWALEPQAEKNVFEAFMDRVMSRRADHPGMHIYHYAPYEETALKRLSTKYATREDELDRLLRSNRLIDLHAVVKQSLRASVEQYSIKDLEEFYGFQRTTDLREASRALARVEAASALGQRDRIDPDDLQTIEAYNRDDCFSTRYLRDWLEGIRAQQITAGETIDRPEEPSGDASDGLQAHLEEMEQVAAKLLAGLPVEEAQDGRHPHRLLANLLPYYRREAKCAWWDYFFLQELEPEALRQHQDALQGLTYVGAASTDPKLQTFQFELQECAIEAGDELHAVGGDKVGACYEIDRLRGQLIIKKTTNGIGVRPESLIRFKYIDTAALSGSLLDFGKLVADTPGGFSDCRYDLLRGDAPRLSSLQLPLERALDGAAVSDLVTDLRDGVLAVQGPPGVGKTHTIADAIIQLSRAGKRIGVTAVGHQVILGVLAKVAELSEGSVRVSHLKSGNYDPPLGVRKLRDGDAVAKALNQGEVVGGTAWLWSRPNFEKSLDVLFVDEAGQASLAMTLAAARAATNLVLVGDPQQLDQPQRGSHPEGADASALKHLIGDHATVPADRGLLLSETRRLHPTICAFTSELYYEGKLNSRAGLEGQEIVGDLPYAGAGLVFVPVEHTGNQNESLEEVTAVTAIVASLLDGQHSWRPAKGDRPRPLTIEDVLVVAPYNRQVNRLEAALPTGARVGTVDKFQGQQAPIVIYSMTTSSASDAPRGMEFLYSPNRMNVATSRAQALAILVACPALLEAECKTPDQMRLANGVCRFVELARTCDAPG